MKTILHIIAAALLSAMLMHSCSKETVPQPGKTCYTFTDASGTMDTLRETFGENSTLFTYDAEFIINEWSGETVTATRSIHNPANGEAFTFRAEKTSERVSVTRSLHIKFCLNGTTSTTETMQKEPVMLIPGENVDVRFTEKMPE